MTPLFPLQELHASIVYSALKKHRSALDCSATGSGKTYCAIEIAKKLNLPTLVICPLAVLPTWKNLCKDQGLKPIDVINYEKLRSKNNIFCRKIGAQYVWNLDKD